MRAFIAVNLNRRLKAEMKMIQQKLDSRSSGFRWTSEQLLHITLKFLGEIEPSNLPSITEKLTAVGFNHAAFALSFAGVGVFPKTSKPRVIWIGVQEGAVELTALARDIVKKLNKDGSQDFKPHVTIGRVKNNVNPDYPRKILKENWQLESTLDVSSFYLMESILSPSGPVYRQVEKFLLK